MADFLTCVLGGPALRGREAPVTLLGFASPSAADALVAALNEVKGPPVFAVRAAGLAALAQQASGRGRRRHVLRDGRKAALDALMAVQRRLEVACLAGPFLPADPAFSRCPEAEIASLLVSAATALDEALEGPGRCHQWDVILRWEAQAVVAARRGEIASQAAGGRAALAEAVAAALTRERDLRAAGLFRALAPVARALRPAGNGTAETGITVLLPAGAEAALEQALGALPEAVSAGATADLRGPLPPVSFAAVRVESAGPAELARAWQVLDLPARVGAADLRQRWHECARRLHPDHGAADAGPMAEAGAAFRLIQNLLPPDETARLSLPALQQRGARRLTLPDPRREVRP